jgi:hypothetical protein
MAASEQYTSILGPEYDRDTRESLKEVLAELGGNVSFHHRGVAGSQELEDASVLINGRQLLIESETYIGLSITGDEDLVTAVRAKVAEKLSAKRENKSK